MRIKDFIIPAIDLQDGKAVRLYKGEKNSAKIYSEDPVLTAKYWEEKGAKHLHIVDLDGAFDGKPKNYKIVEKIINSISIPIEFGGGLRSFEAVETMFKIGVDRVVIGSLAYQNEKEFLKIVEKFPNKVVLGIDAKDGKVAIKGWVEKTEYTPLEFAKKYEEHNIWGYLYTDINRDGALTGVNIETTKKLAKSLEKPVIASGGVSSLEDIKALYQLKDYGVYGVVVGKALYEKKINFENL